MDPELRVMLVVPNPIERAGLRSIIDQELDARVVAQSATGLSALSLAHSTYPDIAVLDHTLSDTPALSLAHLLAFKCPTVQILLYTTCCDRSWILTALREGVRAFVVKSEVERHLAPAIRALADHRPYWEGAVDDEILDQLVAQAPPPAPKELTSRETQVLQLVAQGRTAKQMARILHLSPRTVESHRANLRRKLGFRNHADLFRYAERHGLP